MPVPTMFATTMQVAVRSETRGAPLAMTREGTSQNGRRTRQRQTRDRLLEPFA